MRSPHRGGVGGTGLGSRPPQRPLPRRAVPCRRGRAGIPFRPARLVLGRERDLAGDGRPRWRPERGVRQDEHPAATAQAIARSTRVDGTIIKRIDKQTPQTVSSITTVDLLGISQTEEAFTIARGCGDGPVRRAHSDRAPHEFATIATVGATLHSIARSYGATQRSCPPRGCCLVPDRGRRPDPWFCWAAERGKLALPGRRGAATRSPAAPTGRQVGEGDSLDGC